MKGKVAESFTLIQKKKCLYSSQFMQYTVFNCSAKDKGKLGSNGKFPNDFSGANTAINSSLQGKSRLPRKLA